MPGLQVGGLASGMDTNSIVAQLTALQQLKVTRELKKKDNAQNTLDKFGELKTMLNSLAAKASALHLPKNFNMFKSTSSAEEYATVSGGEGGSSGKYDLSVHQLATNHKVSSNKGFNSVSDPMDFKGKIVISTDAATQKADPRKTEVEVEINKSDSLKDIVNKINATSTAGVKASIMTEGGKSYMVLTSVDSGTQGFYIREGDDNAMSILGQDGLGLIDDSKRKFVSGGSLLTQNGFATGDSTIDQLSTFLGKNTFKQGDVIGFKIGPDFTEKEKDSLTQFEKDHFTDWITVDLYDSSNNPKKISDILTELNGKLADEGINATARLNDCGEIVFDSEDFDFWGYSAQLKMGTFDEDEQKFTDVKKDMGSFKPVNTFLNELNTAQNALYKLDGVFVSSHSNDDDKVVPGTTFSLKKADPNLNIKLSLDVDINGLADKITEFVNDFNEILKFIDENAKALIVEKKDEITGIRSNERIISAFTGETYIKSMKDRLKQAFTGIISELTPVKENGYSTNYSSASRIGIMTTREGYLEVDNEKLTKALTEDLEGVRRLFTADGWSDTPGFKVGNYMKESTTGTYELRFTSDGGVSVFKNGEAVKVQQQVANLVVLENGITIETPWQDIKDYEDKTVNVTFTRGIASQIQNFVEMESRLTIQLGDGRIIDGPWVAATKNYEDRMESLQKRADTLQARVDKYNARIQAQFAALEKSLAALQNQSANMISALSALTPGKK